jgi:hypothetical protein
MPDLSGTTFAGRFAVAGPVGRGGAATVYLATEVATGERVALKVPHESAITSPAVRARLRREVEAAARVGHPSVLAAREVVEDGPLAAVVLPWWPGTTLAAHVAVNGPLAGSALDHLARELLGALEAAHRAGVVHRDVTPGNVLIDGDRVALADFGLARVGEGSGTRTTALGTPGYTAPEVLRGGRADARSDLYGLGAVLHFAATGAPPFGVGDAMQILARQQQDRRPSLAATSLPPRLVATIEAMMEPDPTRRPAGAIAARRGLDHLATPQPSRPSPRGGVGPVAQAIRRPSPTTMPWTVVAAISLFSLVATGWAIVEQVRTPEGWLAAGCGLGFIAVFCATLLGLAVVWFRPDPRVVATDPVAVPESGPLGAARARVVALRAEVRAASVPKLAADDLDALAAELLEQIDALGPRLARIEANLADVDDAALVAAVAEIEARRVRAATLAAAGDAAATRELAALDATLAARSAAVERADQLAAARTTVIAELVAIADAADTARAELLVGDGGVGATVGERLRAEARLAVRARAELERLG